MSNAYIPVFLRKLVIRRAGNRCEYCRLSQSGQEATFHIDHILPVSEGGTTIAENLALACVSCSLRKGAKREYLDTKSGKLLPFSIRERMCGITISNFVAYALKVKQLSAMLRWNVWI